MHRIVLRAAPAANRVPADTDRPPARPPRSSAPAAPQPGAGRPAMPRPTPWLAHRRPQPASKSAPRPNNVLPHPDPPPRIRASRKRTPRPPSPRFPPAGTDRPGPARGSRDRKNRERSARSCRLPPQTATVRFAPASAGRSALPVRRSAPSWWPRRGRAGRKPSRTPNCFPDRRRSRSAPGGGSPPNAGHPEGLRPRTTAYGSRGRATRRTR